MKFTMAQPEESCHPESLLPGARTVVSAALCYYAPEPERPARPRAAAALHVVRRVRGAAREARRARRAARRRVPRARRREPARRPGGGGSERRRLLRQEHDGDHAAARLVGRARNARHGRRARADAAARARLRLLPPLHRRVPDRCARRARHARRDALPLLLDAGACADPGGVPRGARRAGVRLRHLPGRVPVESRHRESAAPAHRSAARRRAARLARRLAARRRGRARRRYDRLFVPRNDGRWLPRNALASTSTGLAERPPAVLGQSAGLP